MNHRNLHLVLGPPGTGKTTQLLSMLEKALSETHPNKVAFVSFTKKAATEARDRAIDKFGYKEESLPWFRTLHSMAYRCLNLNKDDVFDRNDCIALGRDLGLYITYGSQFDEGELVPVGSKGTVMLFLDNFARSTMMSLKDAWKKFDDENICFLELEWFSKSLAAYKERQCVLDFTDMIRKASVDDAWSPDLDYVFVDEAQDLTRSQWAMVEKIARKAKCLVVAGDDDQSIYAWAGADVETFLSLSPRKTLQLDVSYRLPKRVFECAEHLLSRIQHRYPKIWRPRDEEGSVQDVFSYEEIPLKEGEWLILARNRCFAEEAATFCSLQGYHFYCPFASSVSLEVLDAVRIWESLRKGRRVSGAQARLAVSYLKSGEGIARGHKQLPGIEDRDLLLMDDLVKEQGVRTTEIWHQALTRIPEVQRAYLVGILKNGEKLSKPRIFITTIHGAKGGEADNVLLLTDISRRTADNLNKDPDSEHRVFYVAATRARQNLYVFTPTSPDHYQMPSLPYCRTEGI